MRARYATVAAALLSLVATGHTLGAEPTAAGLWQSVDDDTKEPNGWFLIRDNGGVYDGAIVRMFFSSPAKTRTLSATSVRMTATTSRGSASRSSAA